MIEEWVNTMLWPFKHKKLQQIIASIVFAAGLYLIFNTKNYSAIGAGFCLIALVYLFDAIEHD